MREEPVRVRLRDHHFHATLRLFFFLLSYNTRGHRWIQESVRSQSTPYHQAK